MEFKLVNENKLRISLTNEDMESMDITFEDSHFVMDCSNTNTRRIFREIFEKAMRQTGFEATMDKSTLITLQERKNDGCVIVLTKTIPKSDPYIYEKRYKKPYIGTKKKRLLYMFKNSEILFEVCRQLILIGYNGKSDIFADGEKYYLYIEDNGEQALDLIGEYGSFINNPFFGFYLDEHAKKIISSDAVKTFSEIFK